jgi:hypothetical protein
VLKLEKNKIFESFIKLEQSMGYLNFC